MTLGDAQAAGQAHERKVSHCCVERYCLWAFLHVFESETRYAARG